MVVRGFGDIGSIYETSEVPCFSIFVGGPALIRDATVIFGVMDIKLLSHFTQVLLYMFKECLLLFHMYKQCCPHVKRYEVKIVVLVDVQICFCEVVSWGGFRIGWGS